MKFIWLLFLNILSSNFVPTPSKSFRFNFNKTEVKTGVLGPSDNFYMILLFSEISLNMLTLIVCLKMVIHIMQEKTVFKKSFYKIFFYDDDVKVC